ncbi:hypothetical protein FRC02_005167 [Tulasnella sp. 418]|nr:hypothetical protein FRC02_005167 [Tulasnella sp. 418]
MVSLNISDMPESINLADHHSNKPLPIRLYQRSRRISYSPPSHSIPPASRSSSVGTSQQAAATARVKNSFANPSDCEWEEAMNSAATERDEHIRLDEQRRKQVQTRKIMIGL